jgi:hypothetical protein
VREFFILVLAVLSVAANFAAWRYASRSAGYRKDGFAAVWFTGTVLSAYVALVNLLFLLEFIGRDSYASLTTGAVQFVFLVSWAGPPTVWYLLNSERNRRPE